MHEGLGVALVVSASAVSVPTAFVLRPRLPAALCTAILVGCGAAIGAGALLVQRNPTPADWVVAVPLLAVLLPAHVRVLLGPFGPRHQKVLPAAVRADPGP